MVDLRGFLPTATDVIRLSARELGGYLLVAENLDVAISRNHPKNIRNAVVQEWYAGSQAGTVAAAVIQALDLLRRDGYIVQTYDDAVDNEWFVLTDKGRAVKKPDDIFAPMHVPETQRPLVFISCGQVSEEEKGVGYELARLIEESTDCEAYFAQEQHTLESLATNILGALSRCVALVVVMHKRGRVSFPGGAHDRGSVWIEQEVAIAALLQNVFKRDIVVQAYIERGVQREGIRQLLQLNETSFTTNDEIIADFEAKIRSGEFRLKRATNAKEETTAAALLGPSRYTEEAARILAEAFGQAGLLIPSFVMSYRLVIHPTNYRGDIVPEERERDVVARARFRSLEYFPLEDPVRAVNLEDGFEVHTNLERLGRRPEYRELYTLRRSGLFVWVRVSPDDIEEDRQYRASGRHVNASRLTRTIWEMVQFSARFVAELNCEAVVQVAIGGLADHSLVIDDPSIDVPGSSQPARQDRVTYEAIGTPKDLEDHSTGFVVDTLAKCLKALNVPTTSEAAKYALRKAIRTFQSSAGG